LSLYLPIKLYGIVAFVMVFTYFSAGIIFASPESTDSFSGVSQSVPVQEDVTVNNVSYYSLPLWCIINYQIARERWFGGGYSQTEQTYKPTKVVASDDILNMITAVAGYSTIHDDGTYSVDFQNPDINGWNWYQTRVPANAGSPSGFPFNKVTFNQYYQTYVDIRNGGSGGVLGYLTKAGNGIRSFIDIITFNFKDKYGETTIPMEVRVVLAVFMTPLYFIMIIGALPLIALLIEALTAGSTITAVIKVVSFSGLIILLAGLL
jgi:hypothetical protein